MSDQVLTKISPQSPRFTTLGLNRTRRHPLRPGSDPDRLRALQPLRLRRRGEAPIPRR